MANQKLKKPQLVAEIQAALGDNAPTKANVAALLDALSEVALTHLRSGTVVEVPGLVRLKTVEKAATPEKQRKNAFTGQMMTVAAKPASKKVRVSPVKALKLAVI